MKITVELKKGFELTEEQHKEVYSLMGGKQGEPETWEEYLSDFTDEYKPHVIALKEYIEKEEGLMYSTGQDADDWYFVFSDGEVWCYSWRAWGDLMQAIVNKKEGYMKYYM
jgi:hypothetical protein